MHEPRNIIVKAIAAIICAILFFVLFTTAKTSLEMLNLPNISSPTSANQSKTSEFVLPDSDKRYYSYDELNALSDEQLNFAHNEIYARHGRMFKDERYADHFAACSWYKPRYSPEEYDAMPNQLNQFEKANSDLMAQIRAERGIR